MLLEGLSEDIRRLAIIVGDNSKTALEKHLRLTKEAMSRQVAAADSIKKDYDYLKGELRTSSGGEPHEQVITTSALHLTAKVIKERYLALCTRYSLLHKCYAFLPGHREQQTSTSETSMQRFDDLLQEMDAQMKVIEDLVKETEKRRHNAEVNLCQTHCRSEADKHIIRILYDTLTRRDEEIISLSTIIATMTSMQQSPVQSTSVECQATPSVTTVGSQTEP
ncbi:unnamed protein product [Cylicostephanus goldi]|uniref:Uncharacterized protein n=1 Tax=Cylicostephanus goldi TaxID=71465 RepID=A0A3P6RRA4_CYLGO|nr:unnamed protein product [Cylicostephanus goldi]